MTITLDPLGDGSVSDRNFLTLMHLVPDMGIDPTTGLPQSVGIRFGVQNVTHTASTQGTAAITHGLGKAPVTVICTCNAGSDGTAYTVSAFSLGATTFSVVTTRSPAFTGTVPVFWVAIG